MRLFQALLLMVEAFNSPVWIHEGVEMSSLLLLIFICTPSVGSRL
jgi:hypothetical protein